MRALVPLLLLALLFSPLRSATPFPHETSDLKPDPRARFGTLPNGLRYVVRPNSEPKERASLRLLIEAGALHETEQQRGLAHFLEHMAFNGSQNFGPDELIKFFQRMGMNFGGDTNASTGFERTLYMLELPDTKPETLAEGWRVFADYAAGLLLQPDEIEKERGIILSEKRARDSVGYRTLVARIGFLLDGTAFPERLPIGTTDVIQGAGREEFLDFYNTWYRPELMSIVAVGDFDPAIVEKQIVETFSSLKARAPARPAPDWGRIASREGVHTFYHHEPEAPNTVVGIMTITPYQREQDNAANRLKYLPRSLAHAMLNRRLAILAKKEGAPFIGGGSNVGEAYNFYREASIALTCHAPQWEGALAVADQELRRALEHGFQPAELKEVVANFRNGLEQAVKTEPTRRSHDLADEIAGTIIENNVFTTAADNLALYGPALEKVTIEDCLAAMREAWSAPHRLVLVTGNAKVIESNITTRTEAEKAIASAYEKSRAVAVEAPEQMEELQWAYTDFGLPGKVAKREHVEDLDITLITFENGVRLNLKKTGFEANRIRMSVRVGTGQLTEPKDKPGLAIYTGQTYVEGGLGRHSVDDLRRVLAGRTVGAGFSATGDAFVVGGFTNREDLLLQMQLVAARITDPGFRPEAARQAAKAIEQAYLSFEHTASGPFNLEVARLLASGDHRFGLPPKEEMMKRNLDEVRAWVTPELERGAMEVAIVGDFDLEPTIDAVARTLGALPPRQPRPDLMHLRQVKFPAEPFFKEYTIATEIPKGEVRLFWPTTDGMEIHRARRLNMLSEVFSDRLRIKVREELGDAYSPGVGSAASDLYPGYGYMLAGVTVDPPRAKQVADIIAEIASGIAGKGVSDDELERAKKPVLTTLRESARTNSYWLNNVVGRAQERPEMLDWARSRYADNEAITTAELAELAKAYLPATRASRVIVIPQPKPDAMPVAAPAGATGRP